MRYCILANLSTVYYEYEERHKLIPDIHGVELLKALIDEFGLRQKDLVSIFQTESIVSEAIQFS